MKRIKRHKVKKENPECSTSQAREQEEHDLAYYIHDRVELMHQVFSILKYKELKAMAPECVRNLAIGDLQELCTEELLGISSKRLLAILDGAEPPSDTESSSLSPPPDMETISLDSISSDEELLASSGTKKKKHKHRRRNSKSKSKKRDKSKEPEPLPDENTELSRASRAGLTVLELLELQARARAIRAQLQQEQVNKRPSETTVAESNHHSSDNDEVEIKEEPPDVVEISSEDEKPDVDQLKISIAEKPPSPKALEIEVVNTETDENSQIVTKRINNLIITVPQTKPTRKIKLNRSKLTVSVANDSGSLLIDSPCASITGNTVAANNVDNSMNTIEQISENKAKKKKKDKKKKTLERDGSDHDEITLQLSDSEKMDLFENLDESRKNYERVSSSSEDTESRNSDDETSSKDNAEIPHSYVDTCEKLVDKKNDSVRSDPEVLDKNNFNEFKDSANEENNVKVNIILSLDSKVLDDDKEKHEIERKDLEKRNITEDHNKINVANESMDSCTVKNVNVNESQNKNSAAANESTISYSVQNTNVTDGQYKDIVSNENLPLITSTQEIRPGNRDCEIDIFNNKDSSSKNRNKNKVIEMPLIRDIPILNDGTVTNIENKILFLESSETHETLSNSSEKDKDLIKSFKNTEELAKGSENDTLMENFDKDTYLTKSSEKDLKSNNDPEIVQEINKSSENDLSEGELSDRQSSEVEAVDVPPVVVCISDEENPSKDKNDKKKKKKDKKSKKDKKNKKSKSNFCEGADQNFFRDKNEVINAEIDTILPNKDTSKEKRYLDSDVYEILELSDDSSCYEVEGTVLSKEPTANEIQALSAKIDEIEREEVITEEQIREHEQMMKEKEFEKQANENMENISWRDRYLGSNKVKRVLTTANIINALRKKNKELKKKIEHSKKMEDKEIPIKEKVPNENYIQLEEGSMEQYSTLQGSNKYVDPVTEPVEDSLDATDKADYCNVEPKEENITKEMKKDAKQLLKMYKRLLNHNDMNKQTDPNKKKKKKQKKRDKQTSVYNNDAVVKIPEKI